MTKKNLVGMVGCAVLLTTFSLVLTAQSQSQSKSGAQTAPAAHQHEPGHEHGAAAPAKTDAPKMDAQSAIQLQALSGMGGHEHKMGPHMKMTELRPMQPGDKERADKVLAELGPAIEKYKDYKVALANGYKVFTPDVQAQSPQIHFLAGGAGGGFGGVRGTFNATKPSALMYEKDAKLGYKLVGAMYTLPQNLTEDQLNKYVPLSMAQWHLHTNACSPPPGQVPDIMNPNSDFGLMGKISTEKECKAAGGQFLPVIFGWMVHAYPWDTGVAAWDPERQMPMAAMEHDHQH